MTKREGYGYFLELHNKLKGLLDYKSTDNIAKHNLMNDFAANGEFGISRGQTLQVVTKNGWRKGVPPLKAVSLDIE